MNTTTAQSLLTPDLASRSTGSAGRHLMSTLETYCLDLLGTSSPLGYALRLQERDRTGRHGLEELLEWTSAAGDLVLVGLVALAPELDRVASRLGRGSPSADTVSEVLTQATQALRWTHELLEGERSTFVLEEASRRTRWERRRMARHNVPTESWPVGLDVVEAECPQELLDRRLALGVDLRVITESEKELIETTRMGGRTLREVAHLAGVPYDTLRIRRSRAEQRLRSHHGADEVAG